MNDYRPPRGGYVHPPGQDPHVRPGSTTYAQPPPGVPGYGTSTPQSASWNAPPSNQQYNPYTLQGPLPPPPPGPPPVAVGSGYYFQASNVAGQSLPPALPPRLPQPYGSTSTPPNAGGYRPPGYGGGHASSHQRLPSLPAPYQEAVAQNVHGWPQHPQYSSQPPSHNYEPAGPGSQGQSSIGGPQHMTGQAPSPSSQYHAPGGQEYFQNQGQPATPQPGPQYHDPSPATSSIYSPDDPSHSQYMHPVFQGQENKPQPTGQMQQGLSGYAPPYPGSAPSWMETPNEQSSHIYQQIASVPRPPPKPQSYTQDTAPNNQGEAFGNSYQEFPPTDTRYPHAYGGQYGHQDQSNERPPYGTSHENTAPQGHAAYGQLSSGQHGYPQRPPSQDPTRPYSNPQYAVSKPTVDGRYPYPQPPGQQDPVSPLQSRQSFSSINMDRPASTLNIGGPARSDSQKSKHSSHYAPEATVAPPKRAPASTFAFSSDWEHFGPGADEIDDTAMYGVKSDEKNHSPKMASVELPGDTIHERSSSVVSAPETNSWHPSPAIAPVPGATQMNAIPSPTPPPVQQAVPPPPPLGQSRMTVQQPPANSDTAGMDEADYIPPMPETPPRTQRQARAPITIGGAPQMGGAPPTATSYLMDGGNWQPPVQSIPQQARDQAYAKPMSSTPLQEAATAAHPAKGLTNMANYAMGSASFTPAPLAPRKVSSAEPELLRKAQKEVEELKAKLHQSEAALGQLKTVLAGKESQISQMNARLAERDSQVLQLEARLAEKVSIVAQKSAEITQKEYAISEKDTEIMQRTTHLKELQGSLAEITDNFTTLKNMTADQEVQLQTAKNANLDLTAKFEQNHADLDKVKSTHETETADLMTKITQIEAALATAKTEAAELKTQAESEKAKFKSERAEAEAKVKAKAAEPVDIAPGLDPWFKGSLERFKDMLYTESKPIPVHEKLQVFQELVNAEARLRGIDMPFGPKGEARGFTTILQPPRQATPPQKNETLVRPKLATAQKESEGFVLVEPENDLQYSPGGRPILNVPTEQYSPGGRPIMHKAAPSCAVAQKASEKPLAAQNTASVQKPAYQAFSMGSLPAGSAATTPGSRGPSPMAQIEAQPPKPSYMPFTWNPSEQNHPPLAGSPPVTQRSVVGPSSEGSQSPVYKPLYKREGWKALDSTSTPPVDAASNLSHADILMDHVPGIKLVKKRDSIPGLQTAANMPGSLKPKASEPANGPAELPASVTPPPDQQRAQTADVHAGALKILASLLPAQITTQPSTRVQDLTKALDKFSNDYSFVRSVTKTWEDKTTSTRKNLETQRARRQAELEKRNNDLFDSGEIGYGDFDTLEAQAKEEELRLKADEDVTEYQSYSKEVFEAVFEKVQEDISGLADLQSQIEGVLRNSSGGLNVVSGKPEDVSLSQAIVLLLKVHERLEVTHAEVVKAVRERDRKYKLTQTKPLYAKGDIAAMKRVEKAFEEAEKKAEVRARVERAERCKRIWTIMDAEMERGAASNEDYAADVLTAAEDAGHDAKEGAEKEQICSLVEMARKVLDTVYDDTETVMRVFEKADMQLNECEYDVSVASAKLKGDAKEYFDRLEVEKKREDGKLRADGEKRIEIVRKQRKEAEDVLGDVVAALNESEDEGEDRERKKMALEAARRRNGQA